MLSFQDTGVRFFKFFSLQFSFLMIFVRIYWSFLEKKNFVFQFKLLSYQQAEVLYTKDYKNTTYLFIVIPKNT